MGNYLTFEHLNILKNNLNLFETSAKINRNYSSKVTVFLSHRHTEEKSLIEKVRAFFTLQGVNLYIDWLDKSMPQVTNDKTASKLKLAINLSDKFIVLATPKSIESIWIPWELGLADQIKGLVNIAILPIVNENNNWKKREYYQLYNRIENVNNEWTVLKPNYSYYGIPLKKWLNS